MSLKVWLPFDNNLNNNGVSNYTFDFTKFDYNSSGKLGTCLKTRNSLIDTKILKDDWNYSVNSISFGAWLKFNKDEIATYVNTKTYDSNNHNVAHGTVFGKNAYGGLAIRWKTNTRYSSGTTYDFTKIYSYVTIRNSNSVTTQTSSYTITFDAWTHIFAVIDREKKKLNYYVNGDLYASASLDTTKYTPELLNSYLGNFYINQNSIDGGNGYGMSIPYYINDFRLYDEALSPRQVKDISNGLVAHYKFDNVQQPNNCYTNPTFNVNPLSGWNHWGRTGHKGSSGQSGTVSYIYRPSRSLYSHWVANGDTATGEYLLYQSPAFAGGYRSLFVICKEQNSIPIDESVCFPAWNARSGGAESNKWTSVNDLGNGFYLCKCEGIKQDGSNDLVGIYVCPGYKVYFSECYLENDKEKCSDFLHDSYNQVTDVSGYGHNLILGNGTSAMSIDTARYNTSTLITNDYFYGSDFNIKGDSTFSVWFKPTAINSNQWICNLGNGTGTYCQLGIYITPSAINGVGGNSTYAVYNTTVTNNVWYHVICTRSGTNLFLYVNGDKVATGVASANIVKSYLTIGDRIPDGGEAGQVYGYQFKGSISDLRLYAKALTDFEIKRLYELGSFIDNKNNLNTYEFIEE